MENKIKIEQPSKCMGMALLSSVVNGMLIYALSMELSSNMYYSTTQFATLYTTCIMFFGHGLGGVLFSKFKSVSKKQIKTTFKLWIFAIILTFFCVFKIFPPVMELIQNISNKNIIFGGDKTWLKMLVSGCIEMPVFLTEGMVYAAIFSYVRLEYSEHVPKVTAFSTIGSALGYLLGIVIPDFPGINTVFLVSLVLLFLVVLDRGVFINVIVIVVLLFVLKVFNIDLHIEAFRSEDNQVYANVVHGEVVDYDWSRFQKSEYIVSGEGENKKIHLTLNGAMQVMASQNPDIIKNIGYEIIYQRDFVEGKRVLIVGGGMGRGAQTAVNNGASHVDVVDIEPALNKKYDVYKEYNGDIYNDKRVNFYVMDGRVALKSLLEEKYDLIVFEGVINEAAVYSLNITTEGYLNTAQAVKDAVDILSEDGIFLDYTINAEKTIQSFISEYPELIPQYDTGYIYAYVKDNVAANNYYVSIAGMSRNYDKMIKFEDGLTEYKGEGIEISDLQRREITQKSEWPITDDRPFPNINSIQEINFEIFFGVFFLLLALGICFYGIKKEVAQISYLQFLALGMAMMMIELYVVNKLNFFLNDSMMSYSIGTAIFLTSFAIGNAKSMKITLSWKKFGIIFLLAITCFSMFFNLPVRNSLIEVSIVVRIIIVILLLSPVAFLCGTFFPRLLLNLVDEKNVASSMGYVMLLDAFGVAIGFFIYNYIGCLKGYNYALPVIIFLYFLEITICYKKKEI